MAQARTTDKATSHKAAKKFSGTAHEVMAYVASRNPDRTANELAELCRAVSPGTMAETFRKRVRELIRNGKLEEMEARKCTITGYMATTYKAIKK